MLALSFLITGSIMGQQKLTKVSQSIKVNKDVKVNLNTSNCNVVFDTWNKDVIEIEAYIEGEQLSDEELQEALKSWGIDIDASMDNVSIKTTGHSANVWVYNTNHHGDSDAVHAVVKELQFELADVIDLDFQVEMAEMPEMPPLPPMPPMPELPELPELPNGMYKIKFDYEAYKKDGDKYLKAYSKEFDAEYGEDFAKKMEEWGEKFGEQWSENYEKQIEAWAKKFEEKYGSEEYAEKMEAWGERYAERAEHEAARFEAQADRMAAQAERHVYVLEHRLEGQKMREKEREMLSKEREQKIEKMVHGKSNSKVKKTIKIKMPKSAKLEVDVRHGEIEFATNIDNLKADLAYTKFKAHSINGSLTSINASYSPISVTHWNLGELNLNYVKQAKLENVKHLVLNATSSNIDIEKLFNSAIIEGNIGDLKIMHIDDKFTNLNVILQNSNAVISLPKVDHNVQYKGTSSRFSHPEKISKENTSNFSIGNLTNGKSIIVNAKYSNVIMQ